MIDFNKQLQPIPESKENIFFINSKFLDENIDYINKQNIHNIGINSYITEFNLKNFNFLLEIKKIKRLEIVESLDVDISAIELLSAIEYFYINLGNKQKLNFSELRKLKSLNFTYNKYVTGIEKCLNLENLVIRKGDDSFFDKDIFKNLKKLSFLQIVQCKLPDSLNFLESNKMLKHLEFHYCKSVIDLDFLKKMYEQLEVLKIGNCKKIESINVLPKLTNLNWLALVDSIPLENTSFLNKLNKLEYLIVLGTSFFINGDLRGLKDKYKHLGIDNKKHYILE